MRPAILFLCVLGLWVAPVAAQQAPLLSNPDAVQDRKLTDVMAIDAANRRFLAGDMNAAVAAYKRALAAFPDSEFKGQVLYRLGSALVSLGQEAEAREYWERLLLTVPDSPFNDEVGTALLAIYRQEADWDRALDILLQRLGKARGADKAAILDDIAQVRLALGEPERAVKALLKRQHYLPPEVRAEGLEALKALIDQAFDVADLSALAGRFNDPIPGAWVYERLLNIHLQRREVHWVNRWAGAYLQAFPNRPFARQVKKEIRTLSKTLRNRPHRVAVLLPLSGDMAEYGRRVLNGIQIAAREAALPTTELALWVRDQGDDAAVLSAHIKPLLKEADPQVLIGPLLSSQVRQAARLTRNAGVPLITPLVPTPKTGYNGVVGLGVQPEREGIAAARYGVRNAKLMRFVVLAPSGSYGDQVVQGFATELTRLGGEIQETLRYNPDQPDVRGAVEQLVANDLAGDGAPEVTKEDIAQLDEVEQELAGLLEKEDVILIGQSPPPAPLMGPPIGPHPYFPGFDGVFIVGTWAQVVMVAPQLPFHDINVPRLGNAGWYDPRSIADSALIGTRLVSPLRLEDGLGQTFAKAYQATYDETPDLFSALGYDAMRLALKGLAAARSEASVWNGLVGAFDGVTGAMTVAEDGTVARDFSVLKVRRRGFMPVAQVGTGEEPVLPEPMLDETLGLDTVAGSAQALDTPQRPAVPWQRPDTVQ